MAFVVGIAGGSCSGKTTLAQALVSHFNRATSVQASLLMQDSYYADLSGMTLAERDRINFDHPSALDFDVMRDQLAQLKTGASIACPVYDFSRHQRCAETQTIESAPVIIVEGTLILEQAILLPLFDLRVFVYADESLRLERRIQRDIKERGRTQAFAEAQFHQTVAPMHNAFVDPSMQHAQVIVEGALATQLALEQVLAHIPAP